MSSSSVPPFEGLLQLIDRAAPTPWYPGEYAASRGVPRDALDGPLDQLRLAGLIAFTPWVSGKGQGYELTPHGARVLRSPSQLAGLKRGYLPKAPEYAPDEEIDPALVGTPLGRGEAIRQALLSPDKPNLTKILIGLNVVVYLVGVVIALRLGDGFHVMGNQRAARLTGAILGADILNGHWWRLLTCCFVHHGLIHLGVNMYFLWVIGSQVERVWGRGRYLAIYLLAGLGGSCAGVFMTPDSLLAGASGALWGTLTSLAAWLLLNRAYLPKQMVSEALGSLTQIIIINVVISFIPGISWAAHFGGGLVGVAVAALLNQHRFTRGPGRWFYLAAVALVPLLCAGALVRQKENPNWRKRANEVQKAVEVMDENAQRKDFGDKFLGEIAAARDGGLAAIQRAARLARVPRDQREQPDVTNAVNDLEAARAKIEEEVRRLENAPAYDSEFVRGAVDEAVAALLKEKRVAELSEQHLTDARWGQDDDDKLEKAENLMEEAWGKFRKRLK